MEPFLAIFSGALGEQYSEFQQTLEKELPVDFLFVTEAPIASNTYRFTTPNNFFNELEEIQGDYALLLLVGPECQRLYEASFQSLPTKLEKWVWKIQPVQKQLEGSQGETHDDLLRYFALNGYTILIDGQLTKIKGISAGVLEKALKANCLNNRETLDNLLKNESCLYFPKLPDKLKGYAFLTETITPQVVGVIEFEEKVTVPGRQADLPRFTFVKPYLHLWIYAKPYATAGSLAYDFQKLLKESKHLKEEVKDATFSQESGLNEQNFSFLDNFETDNELEVAFKMDTMRTEIEAFAATQGLTLVGERASKSARMVLLGPQAKGLQSKAI